MWIMLMGKPAQPLENSRPRRLHPARQMAEVLRRQPGSTDTFFAQTMALKSQMRRRLSLPSAKGTAWVCPEQCGKYAPNAVASRPRTSRTIVGARGSFPMPSLWRIIRVLLTRSAFFEVALHSVENVTKKTRALAARLLAL